MNFMVCTTCQSVVQQNDIGTCLACQRGFIGVPQEDNFEIEPETNMEALEIRQKEIEDALEDESVSRRQLKWISNKNQFDYSHHRCCTCHSSWDEHMKEVEEKDGEGVALCVDELLSQRQKETTNADEIRVAEKVDAREQSQDGGKMGKRNAKKRKTPQKKGNQV